MVGDTVGEVVGCHRNSVIPAVLINMLSELVLTGIAALYIY